MKYLICGLGKSNNAILKSINGEKNEIYTYDDKEQADYNFARLEKELPFFDKAFIAPGLCQNRKNLSLIKKVATSIDSELNMALKLAKGKVHIIGVTGSNGKTSTIKFLEYLLKKNGCKVLVAGNIGNSLFDKIKNLFNYDYLLVEISSFQGEFFDEKCLDELIVTSISPNHLDAYYSYSEYIAVKKRICYFSHSVYLDEESQKILNLKDAHVISTANEKGYSKNFFLARSLLLDIGFLNEKLTFDNIEEFFPKYRYQKFYELGKVSFINDSKSTSLSATEFALNLSEEKTILILGGHLKSSLDHKLIADKIMIYGKEASRFIPFVSKYELYNSLKELIDNLNFDFSKDLRILFSPGGSSLEYKNYIERGQHFEIMVKEKYGSQSKKF